MIRLRKVEWFLLAILVVSVLGFSLNYLNSPPIPPEKAKVPLNGGYDPALRALPSKLIMYWVPVSAFMGSHMLRNWDKCPVNCHYTEDHSKLENASAVIFHLPAFSGLSGFPKIKYPDQLWVSLSMESDIYYRHQTEPTLISKFDATMNYHLNSTFPTLYLSSKANYSRPAVEKTDGLVSAFISNSGPLNDRSKYVTELMNYIKIDSYGHFMNNANLGSRKKMDVIGKYKFHIAFENSNDMDYVTEKMFHALLAGTVPLYMGAPNIDVFTPSPHSIIKVTDFESPQKLAEYLLYLDSHDDEYQKYLAWKTEGFSENFQKMLEMVKIESRCKLCMKLHGIDWRAPPGDVHL